MNHPHESQADDDEPWGIRDDEMGFLRTFKTEYDRDQFYGAVSHRYIKPVLFGPAISDGEQLRECINSGQVSAAQVVAHAEVGELMITPYISQAQFDRTFPVAHQEAVELPPLPEPYGYGHTSWLNGNIPIFTAEQMQSYATAALAAERAEVARLLEALEGAYALAAGYATTYQLNHQLAEVHPTHQAILDKARAALTAPGEKHD